MFGKVHNTESFGAFGVAAFDVEIKVYFLKCSAEDGSDVACGRSTAIRAFAVFFLGRPADDAIFTEEFSTSVTLVRVEYNLYANGALKGLMRIAYKPIWVIS